MWRIERSLTWKKKIISGRKITLRWPSIRSINCVFASSHTLETIYGIWSRDRFSASVENYLFGAKVEWIASNRIEWSGSRQWPRKMEFLRGILFYELLAPRTLRIPRAGQRESRFTRLDSRTSRYSQQAKAGTRLGKIFEQRPTRCSSN